jgi:hypothetical protein
LGGQHDTRGHSMQWWRRGGWGLSGWSSDCDRSMCMCVYVVRQGVGDSMASSLSSVRLEGTVKDPGGHVYRPLTLPT